MGVGRFEGHMRRRMRVEKGVLRNHCSGDRGIYHTGKWRLSYDSQRGEMSATQRGPDVRIMSGIDTLGEGAAG